MKKVKFLLLSCVLVACNSSDGPDSATIQDAADEVISVAAEDDGQKIPESVTLSTKKEDSQCFVRSVYVENGLVFVDVDFILFETIDIGDGLEGTEVVNNNPKIRTYILSRENENLPTEEEIRSTIGYDSDAVFYISAEDGYVVELIETGIPG